jgi:hypothetical protein
MVNANRVDSVVALSNNPIHGIGKLVEGSARFAFLAGDLWWFGLNPRPVSSGKCWFALTGYKWASPL